MSVPSLKCHSCARDIFVASLDFLGFHGVCGVQATTSGSAISCFGSQFPRPHCMQQETSLII